MAFGLSFADDFFQQEGDEQVEPETITRPTSVYQALAAKPEDWWNELASEVFDTDGGILDIETVIEKIKETDTCGDMSSPVDVWIDDEGWFTVDVYDAEDVE